jgi:hypothetical protein
MVQTSIPKAVPGDTTSLAARYERAKQLQEQKERGVKSPGLGKDGKVKSPAALVNEIKQDRFGVEVWWVFGVFGWLL